MSERKRNAGPALLVDTLPGLAAAPQAGAMLRQMRQAAGVDPLLLASALKIAPQKIQALEEGRMDDLPGLTFARSLAFAICRYFAADPEPVLALMPQAVSGLTLGNATPHEPFKLSTFHVHGGSLEQLRRRVGVPGRLLAVVAVLLTGALAVWFVPGRHVDAPPLQAADTTTGTASEPVAESASVSGPEVAPAVDAASQSMPAKAALPATSTAVPAAQASAAPVASVPVTSAASAPQAGQNNEGAAVEQDVISFSATTGDVWIGVRDGSGKLILNRTLLEGDSVTVGGELPLSVTVGNKTAVAVTVRGQPIDLGNARHGVVARFTVDPVAR